MVADHRRDAIGLDLDARNADLARQRGKLLDIDHPRSGDDQGQSA